MITGNQVLSSSEVLRMIQEILGRKTEIVFDKSTEYGRFHYLLSPYRFTPRAGVKVVPQKFVDIGQGILDLIDEIYCTQNDGDNCN